MPVFNFADHLVRKVSGLFHEVCSLPRFNLAKYTLFAIACAAPRRAGRGAYRRLARAEPDILAPLTGPCGPDRGRQGRGKIWAGRTYPVDTYPVVQGNSSRVAVGLSGGVEAGI